MYEKRKQKRYMIGPINVYPYPAHLHDVVEIVILREGYLNMTVNGKMYALKKNSGIMIFPGMIHSYESASEDASGLFVGMLPGLIEEFRHTLHSLWPLVPMFEINEEDEDLVSAIDKLESFYQEGKIEYPLTIAYIHLLVACMLQKLELAPREELRENNLMYEVMQYIQDHYMENLTQDSVAKAMGISSSHLSHLFSQKMDINFRRFLNTIRIENACLLLQEPDQSIKSVCFECGFENTRTFHRVFLEEQKMTPGEYREKLKNGWLNG